MKVTFSYIALYASALFTLAVSDARAKAPEAPLAMIEILPLSGQVTPRPEPRYLPPTPEIATPVAPSAQIDLSLNLMCADRSFSQYWLAGSLRPAGGPAQSFLLTSLDHGHHWGSAAPAFADRRIVGFARMGNQHIIALQSFHETDDSLDPSFQILFSENGTDWIELPLFDQGAGELQQLGFDLDTEDAGAVMVVTGFHPWAKETAELWLEDGLTPLDSRFAGQEIFRFDPRQGQWISQAFWGWRLEGEPPSPSIDSVAGVADEPALPSPLQGRYAPYSYQDWPAADILCNQEIDMGIAGLHLLLETTAHDAPPMAATLMRQSNGDPFWQIESRIPLRWRLTQGGEWQPILTPDP